MNPTRTLLTLAFASLALAACRDPGETPPPAASTPAPAAPAPTPAAPAKPALGTFGFDTAGMDTSIAPGDDFYAYANGTWHRTFEIPADRSRFSMFTELTERALSRTRAIVEEAAADSAAAGDAKKVGDFYAAYLDDAAIEAKGVAPIAPELEAIAAIADAKALAGALGGTLRADVDLLNATDLYTDRLFGLWVSQHLDRPTEVAPYLVQGGLGLPDRDFYLEGGRFEEIRTKYAAYIEQLFTLAGIEGGADKAKRIVALETAIARVHATQVESNDVKAGANYWPRAEFGKRAPGLDWDAFFAAAHLDAAPELVVWQPKAVAGISALVAGESLDAWKDYLAFHALDRAAPLLEKAFVDAHFAFRGNALEGTPQLKERWKRALEATDVALGEAV